MRKPNSRWITKNPSEDIINTLVSELGVSSVVAEILVNRNIIDVNEAKTFLGETEFDFYDPFMFSDMEKVIYRIEDAIDNDEKIIVYGDYDADGVTSTSIVMLTLQKMGAVNVGYYIPNRFTEGYGPNKNAIEVLHSAGTNLIISVDNGIAAIEEIDYANELGIDFIITDHHQVGEKLPNAFAIIHPNLLDGKYPFHYLAGAGVALKLSHALLGEVDEELLALATIGTVADLVALKDENRHLVKIGLEAIRRSNLPGIAALANQAKIELSTVSEETVGFVFGPRINAAGRLEDASLAVELFLSESAEEALEVANKLEQLNRKRQNVVTGIVQEAIQLVETKYPTSEFPFIFLAKNDWHVGVVGIVASKLVDKFNCPAIILGESNVAGLFKGSARSVPRLDIYEALSSIEDKLHHFGGHKMAAGLGVDEKEIDNVRQALCEFYKENFSGGLVSKEVEIDASISVNEISVEIIKQISQMAPFGSGNPEPKVLIENVNFHNMKRIGSNLNHLKAEISQGESRLDVVGFGFGDEVENISVHSEVSLIGKLSINEWRNVQKPQFMIEDLSCKSAQVFDYRSKQLTEVNLYSIPEPKRFIVFNEVSKTFVPEILRQKVELACEVKSMNEENVCLIDCPTNIEILKDLVANKGISRLYLFLKLENQYYFREMPTREQFKQMYAFLLKNEGTDANALIRTKSGVNETRKTILEVFCDLEFVRIEDGAIYVVPETVKKDLATSLVYKQKEAQYHIEETMLSSSSQELIKFFENIM